MKHFGHHLMLTIANAPPIEFLGWGWVALSALILAITGSLTIGIPIGTESRKDYERRMKEQNVFIDFIEGRREDLPVYMRNHIHR